MKSLARNAYRLLRKVFTHGPVFDDDLKMVNLEDFTPTPPV